MAVYRNIQISFWTDPKVTDEFTPEDKYFYLYLFTNPHTNLCGCYEISKKQVSWETGYSIDTIERLIERFEKIHKVIQFSTTTKELLIVNWYKYNWTTSDKFRKPLLNEIESIKCKSFKDYLMKVYEGDTVSIPYLYGMDTTVSVTVSDTVTDTGNNKPKKSKKFIPPTIEEVTAYCAERKNNINAEGFIDYYASQSWKKANGRPLEDWKAAVRTWEKYNIGNHKKQNIEIPVPEYIKDQINGIEEKSKVDYAWLDKYK